MLYSGLCSITFRQLTPREIVDLVAKAGLDAIEWGGDVHVPHGDLARAREVRALTEAAGIAVSSYGSYYRVGHDAPAPFESVLATACELRAPNVRVWAGDRGSAAADAQYREAVVSESRRIASLAAAEGLVVSFEFHANSLTDTNESAVRLLTEIAHPAIRTYWQPDERADQDYRVEGLRALLPRLTNLHAFAWGPNYERYPLSAGATAWAQYLGLAANTGRDHHVLLEFVRDDSPAAFLEDAATLREWIESRRQQ